MNWLFFDQGNASPFLMRVGRVFNEVIHNFIHVKCVKKKFSIGSMLAVKFFNERI